MYQVYKPLPRNPPPRLPTIIKNNNQNTFMREELLDVMWVEVQWSELSASKGKVK